jgi:hypothetical protein
VVSLDDHQGSHGVLPCSEFLDSPDLSVGVIGGSTEENKKFSSQ